jgi:hypothetical protein
MATTTSITTTYAGEFAGQYISAALLSGKTLNESAIGIKPNVKYKEVIKKVDTSGLIANATCDFTDTGSVTLTERILQPEEFQVNVELCKKDFRSDWEAIQMGVGAFDQLPPNFADFLIAHVAGKVAEKTEQNIWGGVNATAGEFDGFSVLMAADSDVNDAANDSATSFTSANIVSLLENVLDSVPSGVYGREDLTIYAPTVAFKAYIRSLGGYGASGLGAAGYDNKGSQWYNQGNALSFDGVKIQHAPGMPNDHIIAGEASNLYFGTMRFTAGVQYGVGSDLVLLTLA